MLLNECCWQVECTCPKADEHFHWKIVQSMVTSKLEYKIKSNYPSTFTPYKFPNTTHWVECASDISCCPVFPGDTRITMVDIRGKGEKISEIKMSAIDLLKMINKIAKVFK